MDSRITISPEIQELLYKTIKDFMVGNDGLPADNNTDVYYSMVSGYSHILIKAFTSELSPYKHIVGTYENYEHVGDTMMKTITSMINIELYPNDNPHQLTEMNAYLGSAPVQAKMFDMMGLENMYLAIEDRDLTLARGINAIPTYIKSDIVEALIYAIKIVMDIGGYSGNNICRNIVARFLPKSINVYRRNGGWESMLNQSLGKSFNQTKGNKSRYPIRHSYNPSTENYSGHITLTKEAIEDISVNAHNREFSNVSPIKIQASAETIEQLNSDLYEGLFNHIVRNVGYQWMQNYRRLRTIEKNGFNKDYIINNNLFPSVKIHEKSLATTAYTVNLITNALAPRPPLTMNEMKQQIASEYPNMSKLEYDNEFLRRDSDPIYGTRVLPLYFRKHDFSNKDSTNLKAAIIKKIHKDIKSYVPLNE